MTSASVPHSANAGDPFAVDVFAGDRTGTILGVFAGVLGGGAVLFFWIMGALVLLGRDSGTIVALELGGAWRVLFLAYPFLFLATLVAGAALLALKRDLEAVGLFGMPVVAAVAYYLALIHLRPI